MSCAEIPTPASGLPGEHVTEWEMDDMFSIGMGEKLLDVHGRHILKCPRCLTDYERIRDSHRGLHFDIPLQRLNCLVSEIAKSLAGHLPEMGASKHPVLEFASHDSYAMRYPGGNPTAVAAFMKRLLVFVAGSGDDSGYFWVKAGELNWFVYNKLQADYHIGEYLDSANRILGMSIIAGNKISVLDGRGIDAARDPYGINAMLGVAWRYPKKVTLRVKKSQREPYHYIVHSKSNKMALVEDYHDEFDERGTTIVYEDKGLCEFLRSDFQATWNGDSVFEWDRSIAHIRRSLVEVPEHAKRRFGHGTDDLHARR